MRLEADWLPGFSSFDKSPHTSKYEADYSLALSLCDSADA